MIEVPLSAAANAQVPEGRSIAVVEVKGRMLRLRLVGKAAVGEPLLAASELALLGQKARSSAATALVRGQAAEAYESLLGSALTVEQAASRLGVNASRIRQRLGSRSLYGIKDAGAWRLPAFQFGRTGLVPGIAHVLQALPEDASPVAIARWLDTPNPDLCTPDQDERPMSPRQWLAEGRPPASVAALGSTL